jgi:hypothetical protein
MGYELGTQRKRRRGVGGKETEKRRGIGLQIPGTGGLQ